MDFKGDDFEESQKRLLQEKEQQDRMEALKKRAQEASDSLGQEGFEEEEEASPETNFSELRKLISSKPKYSGGASASAMLEPEKSKRPENDEEEEDPEGEKKKEGGDASGDEVPEEGKELGRRLYGLAVRMVEALEGIEGNRGGGAGREPKDLKLPTLSKRDPTSWRAWRLRVDNYLKANRWAPDREVEMIFCALADDALRATGTFKRPLPGAQVAYKKVDGTVGLRPYDGKVLLDRLEQQCFVTEQTEEYNRMLLESIYQKAQENIPDLAARYKEQFLLAWPEVVEVEGTVDTRGRPVLLENNKQLIHGFLSAIANVEIAEWAKAFKPTSFTKAIQLAAHKEATLYSLKNKPRAAAPPKPPAFMQEVHAEEAAVQAMGGTGFQGNCHLCAEPNHSWRNCPLAKKYQELSNKRPASGKPQGQKNSKKSKKDKDKGKKKDASVQQVEAETAGN